MIDCKRFAFIMYQFVVKTEFLIIICWLLHKCWLPLHENIERLFGLKKPYVMKHQLRSAVCTEGRRMAGARALWVAAGMKHEQFGKPIIAIVNSFTQFVPGHTHLHEIGQIVKKEIEAMGCYAAEFNTIAIDDGIAMGHDGIDRKSVV